MLRSLHISNYILIDSLDIEFPESLIIITGQTGAGKSIILGALSLLMGSRADASVIRAGADTCVVEAEFDAVDDGASELLKSSEDVEWDGGLLTIRRVIYASGRSRSFINDAPVQVGLLSSLSSHLIDVHSQHQSLLLTDHSYQLSVLDYFAGNASLLGEYRSLWQQVQSLRSELSEVEGRLSRLASERDYNQAQFEQLDSAHLRSGELEELETEQQQLANAEEIRESLFGLDELNSPSDGSSSNGVSAALKDAQRLLERAGKYLPEAVELTHRLESSRIEIEDIFETISGLSDKVNASPERLEAVEDRMSQLYALMRKHSVQSIDELIERRDALSEVLFDSTALESRRDDIVAQLAESQKSLDALSLRLRESRLKAAAPLSERITEDLHFLELDAAIFGVEVHSVPLCATGGDAVTFTFDSTGRRAVDVSKCASGGEISRIMLCLKSLMAEFTHMPTMIFDEIDTGVSGSVADKMGQMICRMGEHMQVLAITHLPQVAAKGSAHFLVSKSGVTSTVERISGERRIQELARMLSGSSITPEAIANAKSLLEA